MKPDERELYDVEYKGCAERYERIYQATWTQFNYFLVAAGVLLGFGKDSVGIYMAGILACLALLFWFWATFEPLNRYGDQVAGRAAALERIYNQEVFGLSDDEHVRGLRHFSSFERRREEPDGPSAGTAPVRMLRLAALGVSLASLPYVRLSSPRLAGDASVAAGTLLMISSVLLSLGVFYRLTRPATEVGPRDPRAPTPGDAAGRASAGTKLRGWALVETILVFVLTLVSGLWAFGMVSDGVLGQDARTRCVGAGVLLTSGFVVACFAPPLLFDTPMHRSVRVAVRFAGSLLHFTVVVLAFAQVGSLSKPTDEPKTDIHLRLDPRTGNVTLKGEGRSSP